MVGRTAAMTAIFTPGYAAAEQMTSAKQGPWTDIYGLAATIYHAIAGKAPPSAFDRMLDDGYEPLGKLAPCGLPAGPARRRRCRSHGGARDRPQSIAGWRPILGMTAAPEADATMVMGKADEAPAGRVSVLGPATMAPSGSSTMPPPRKSKTGLWAGIAAVVLLAIGGGGYYAMATRGPDPEMVKARAAAEAAEEARRKAAEEAEQLRAEKAEQEAKAKADQEAKAKAEQDAKAKADPGRRRKPRLHGASSRRIPAARSRRRSPRRSAPTRKPQRKATEEAGRAPEGDRGRAQGHRVRRRQLRPFRQDADDDRPQGSAG